MARKLTVYGWIHVLRSKTLRRQLGMADHVIQVWAVMAGPSKAACARAVGEKDYRQLFNLSETGNTADCEKALSEPGTVFVTSMQGGKKKYIALPKQEKPDGS